MQMFSYIIINNTDMRQCMHLTKGGVHFKCHTQNEGILGIRLDKMMIHACDQRHRKSCIDL